LGATHGRTSWPNKQVAHDWERAVLFGLVEPPPRWTVGARQLIRALVLLVAAFLSAFGAPAPAFAIAAQLSATTNVFFVTNNADSGPGSLRQAILDANAAPGVGAPDTITVAAGVGPLLIEPLTTLPTVKVSVVLNGGGRLTVADTFAPPGAILTLGSGSSGSMLTGFTVQGGSAGLLVRSSGDVIFANTIGGTSGNHNGVVVFGHNNTIGGTAAGDGNVITGNSANGVELASGAQADLIEGNLIGTDSSGSNAIGNGGSGVLILGGAINNTIGGTSAGSANLISGNKSDGVVVKGTGTSDNVIQGNFIGTNSAGSSALGNGGDGILILGGAINNTIGGVTGGSLNLISGNAGDGVLISGAGTSGNLVLGNAIGTDSTGQLALGNLNGVALGNGAANNTIGGSSQGDGNLVSGNRGDGVLLAGTGTNGNTIQGNSIGTTAGGSPLMNAANGVLIRGGASMNVVGGTLALGGNVIAFNAATGVQLSGSATLGDAVLEDSIFSNGPSGTGPGIRLSGGANGSEPRPSITSVSPSPTGGGTTITGTAMPGSLIEVYLNPSCADPEGKQFLAPAQSAADGSWQVTVSMTLSGGVTATETGSTSMDTSPFSACFASP
jgi:hypothetical protein